MSRLALSSLAALLLATSLPASPSRIAPGPLEVHVTRSDDGKPLASVTVRIGGRFASTSPQGIATLDGVPAGRYPVSIRHPGFDELVSEATLAPGARPPLPLVLTPSPWVAFEGSVLTEGDDLPLAGVRIRLEPVAVRTAQRGVVQFVTSWDGSFRIAEIPVGDYRVRLSAEGMQDRTLDYSVVPGAVPATWHLSRQLETVSLTVRVVSDPGGKPVPGAGVILAEAWPLGRIAEGITDAQGKAGFARLLLGRMNRTAEPALLPACRRSATVRVEAPGFEPAVVPVQLSSGASLEVRLASEAVQAEVEPNGEPGSATPIRTGGPVEFRIERPDDLDFFRFRIRNPSRLTVHLEPGPIESVLRIHDRAGNQLGEAGINPHTPRSLGVGGRLAGEFLVSFEEWGRDRSSRDPFRFRVEAIQAPDGFEPAETAPAARLVQPGETIRASILPASDVDWYRFRAARPSRVRVILESAPTEVVMRLSDAAGNTRVERGINPRTRHELVADIPAGESTLSLEEWGRNGESTEPYVVHLELQGDDGIDDGEPPGGRPRTPRLLSPGDYAGATLFPVGDVDLWTVPVPAAGRIHVRAWAPTEYLFRLRDSEGRVLVERGVNPRIANEIAWDVRGPTTLFAEIREWGDNGSSTDPYALSAWFSPSEEIEVAGPDETDRTATPSLPGEWRRGNLLPVGDVDVIAVPVDSTGLLDLHSWSPTETLVRIRDAAGRQLSEVGRNPGVENFQRVEVEPGPHFVELREWGDNGSCHDQYRLRVLLHRAEPTESLPLRDDPPRRLVLGEAQAYRIDRYGDRDRFLVEVPEAGKVFLRHTSPLETLLRVFDDRTGAQLREWGLNPWVRHRAELEAKGPSRWRIEIEEWGNNGRHEPGNDFGFLGADSQDREIPGIATITATADPYEPTLVRFTATPYRDGPAVATIELDGDGDGRVDLRFSPGGTAEHRYPSEGLHRPVAWLVGDNGVRTRTAFWVEATGPQERVGVMVGIDQPGEDQVLESAAKARIRAMSWSGTPIRSVSLSLDGRPLRTLFTPPFECDLPWNTLAPGVHALVAEARDATGHSATATRRFRISEYFGLSPEDGAVVTGLRVPIRWGGTAFGPSRVRFRQKGSNEWTEVLGESGRQRAVDLQDLEPGRAYEWQPLSGTEPGPVRTVTRVKGLAFGRTRYAATVARDYDQRLGISVRNHGEQPATVRVVCGEPPPESRLLAGFVGEGSEGVPFDLGPGEERELWLGISAQDCVRREANFPIRLTGGQGLQDEAEVVLSIRLPRVELAWEDKGPAPAGLGRLLRLVNRGDPLTDLAVTAPPGMTIDPSMAHGLLPAGAVLDTVLRPDLQEDFQRVSGAPTAAAVDAAVTTAPITLALGPGEKVFGVNLAAGGEDDTMTARAMAGAFLDPAFPDWSRRQEPEDRDQDGRPDRWVVRGQPEGILWVGDDTDRDGTVDFVHADIGEDGQFDYSALRGPGGWEPTNLVEAWLETSFQLPWARTAYEKHDVDVVVNGVVIAELRDRIPEGNFRFPLPPAAMAWAPDGTPAESQVEIVSKHLRGGHYVVNTDFRITARLTGTRALTVAKTQEEAEKAVRGTEGLEVGRTDYSVSSEEVSTRGTLQKGNRIRIEAPVRNLGAVRSRDVAVALIHGSATGTETELARVYLPEPPLSGAVTAELEWLAAAGTHRLAVVVDPDRELDEADRSNDRAELTLVVPGEDAPPELSVLEPAEAAVLTDPRVPVSVRASDDAGVGRVEVAIDGGLPAPLAPAGDGTFAANLVLQPGEHRLAFTAIDGAGSRAGKAVTVRVEAPRPELAILAPEDGARLEARRATMELRVGAGARLVAIRAAGGPWQRLAVTGDRAEGGVELRFGANVLEAMAVDGRGVRTVVERRVECSAQPEEGDEDAPGAEPQEEQGGTGPAEGKGADPDRPGDDGTMEIPGAGPIDAFGPPNTVAGAGRRSGTGPATRSDPPSSPAAPGKAGAPIATGGADDAGASGDPGSGGSPPATDSGGEAIVPPPGSAPATEHTPDSLPPGGEIQGPPVRPLAPIDGLAAPPAGAPAAAGPGPRPAATRPPGGFVSLRTRVRDWYCTNRPQVRSRWKMPDKLRKNRIVPANSEEFRRLRVRFLTEMQMRGMKTKDLERMIDILLKRAARGDQHDGDLPSWMRSIGAEPPPGSDPAALEAWRKAQVAKTEAYIATLLSSRDPELIAQGLKARAESLGQFDTAGKEAADAASDSIDAHQKVINDVAESLPVLGDAMDLYAVVTGETALSGEQLSAWDRLFRVAALGGPLALEELVKRSKSAQDILEGVAEMGASAGKWGTDRLAKAVGMDPADLKKSLEAIGDWATKERSLLGKQADDAAAQAGRAFEASAEGVRDFKMAVRDRERAMDLLDRISKADRNSPEFNQLVRELQQDKTAQLLLNRKPGSPDLTGKAAEFAGKKADELEAMRKELSGHIKKNWYDTADAGVKTDMERFFKGNPSDDQIRTMAKSMGVPEEKALALNRQAKELAAKSGQKVDDLEVGSMLVTNQRPPKPGEVPTTSFGRDRDVTFQLKTKDKPVLDAKGKPVLGPDGKPKVTPGKALGDVDHELAKGSYDRRFADAAGAPPGTDPGKFADAMDQTVTSKKHLEAYNTGEAQLGDFLDKGKQPTITRVQDVRDTMQHKAEHWFHKAEEAAHGGDPIMAARNTAEGMRQTSKQYGDLVVSRMKQYGLTPPSRYVPPRLEKAMDIFDKVGKGTLTPAKAEAMLKGLGLTKGQAVKDLGSFFEGLEKTAGAGFRKVKAGELVGALHKVPGSGTKEWTEKSLSMINEALGRGHISGPQFLKLRGEVLSGALKSVPPNQRAKALADLAGALYTRRLISAAEKENLESGAGDR